MSPIATSPVTQNAACRPAGGCPDSSAVPAASTAGTATSAAGRRESRAAPTLLSSGAVGRSRRDTRMVDGRWSMVSIKSDGCGDRQSAIGNRNSAIFWQSAPLPTARLPARRTSREIEGADLDEQGQRLRTERDTAAEVGEVGEQAAVRPAVVEDRFPRRRFVQAVDDGEAGAEGRQRMGEGERGRRGAMRVRLFPSPFLPFSPSPFLSLQSKLSLRAVDARQQQRDARPLDRLDVDAARVHPLVVVQRRRPERQRMMRLQMDAPARRSGRS